MRRLPSGRTAVAAVLLAAVTASCSTAAAGGQTLADAAAAAQNIPGVAAAEVTTDSVNLSPFERARKASIRLTLEPDWRIAGSTALLGWAATTARSLNDHEVDDFLNLRIMSPDGTLPADWREAAAASGLPEDWAGADYDDETGLVMLSGEDIEAIVPEPWPADPPPIPENAFAPAS